MIWLRSAPGPKKIGFHFRNWQRSALALVGVILAAGAGAALYSRVGSDVPNISALQRAYDREAKSGNAAHDANLLVVDALCNRRKQPGLFYCIVAFTDRRDPDRRLDYDIADVAAEAGEWQLKSGLCKR